MAKVKKLEETAPKSKVRPPITAEGHEKYMIRLAEDLAEKQLKDGTASAMVMCHYLKLGTTRAEAEAERLKNENLLLEAKTRNLNEDKHTKEFYQEVINAIKKYGGHEDEDDVPDLQ